MADEFFRLPSKFEIHEYDIMDNFVWSLPEGRMQDSLESAIRGKGNGRVFLTESPVLTIDIIRSAMRSISFYVHPFERSVW